MGFRVSGPGLGFQSVGAVSSNCGPLCGYPFNQELKALFDEVLGVGEETPNYNHAISHAISHIPQTRILQETVVFPVIPTWVWFGL